ncbi:dihydrodipicolinate synthase family protein [soil metagenome]
MQTTPPTAAGLAGSVIAVPPLCRAADLAIDRAENRKLIRHIESGGVRTLLYGGNANLYNIAPSEYPELLDMLAGEAGDDTLVIPSAGPFFGTMIDQAKALRASEFPTVMVLPTLFPATHSGVATAVRHFVERAEIPAVLYLKDERYLSPEAAAALVADGLISLIKYAVVRDDPADDPFLEKLVGLVGPQMIVSGIGEQPTVVHLMKFGLAGFTSGCVCVNPAKSMAVLAALRSDDVAQAENLIGHFRPLEDLRNAHGPIPVLHHAVAEAGIAQTGPHFPLLSALPQNLVAQIASVATTLIRT